MWAGVGDGGGEREGEGEGAGCGRRAEIPIDGTARWKSCHDSHVKRTRKTKSCLAGWPRPGEKASGKFTQGVS